MPKRRDAKFLAWLDYVETNAGDELLVPLKNMTYVQAVAENERVTHLSLYVRLWQDYWRVQKFLKQQANPRQRRRIKKQKA